MPPLAPQGVAEAVVGVHVGGVGGHCCSGCTYFGVSWADAAGALAVGTGCAASMVGARPGRITAVGPCPGESHWARACLHWARTWAGVGRSPGSLRMQAVIRSSRDASGIAVQSGSP